MKKLKCSFLILLSIFPNINMYSVISSTYFGLVKFLSAYQKTLFRNYFSAKTIPSLAVIRHKIRLYYNLRTITRYIIQDSCLLIFNVRHSLSINNTATSVLKHTPFIL